MDTIYIFLGGGVELLHGKKEFLNGYRNDIIDPVISQLNSREYVKHIFVAKDYSDLTRKVVSGKHQDVYNTYIISEAEIALFIVDGQIGNITKHEIDVAVKSTKTTGHPIVYIYGTNIKDNDEILGYLNQESIYYQHFYDNRDLAAKIKADLENATISIKRKRSVRFFASVVLSIFLSISAYLALRNYSNGLEKANNNCSAQLYLMRYQDVNALTGRNLFTDNLLSNFKYEDSIMTRNEIAVFPVMNKDTLITTTPPFFRIKLHNKHRNTIVFVEAKLVVDQYISNTIIHRTTSIPNGEVPDIDIIKVNSNNSEYPLKSFRQNIAYGEVDDSYYFCLQADENCSFRMRLCAKSYLGEYLYSNFIYVNYVK